MGAVAMCNKVLELGGKGPATYWPPEKPVACLAPERSWPDFGVYKHETVGGTRVGCYVLLPPGMELSQVSGQVCMNICKAVAELALRQACVVDTHPLFKTPRGRYVQYRVFRTEAHLCSRAALYIDWAFSMERDWNELSQAISGIRDHLRERR